MFLVRGGTVVVVGTLKVEFMSCLTRLGVASLHCFLTVRKPHKVEEALNKSFEAWKERCISCEGEGWPAPR